VVQPSSARLKAVEISNNFFILTASFKVFALVPRNGCSSEFLFYRLQGSDLRRYVEMGSDRTAGGYVGFHVDRSSFEYLRETVLHDPDNFVVLAEIVDWLITVEIGGN
jgi:hypothetical protein